MRFSWADESNNSLTQFRTLQLEMRIQEVDEAYHSIRRLVSPSSDEKVIINDLPIDQRSEWISFFREKVDVEDFSIAGHSFGGCTVVSVVSGRTLVLY